MVKITLAYGKNYHSPYGKIYHSPIKIMDEISKIKIENNVYENILKEVGTFPTEENAKKKLEEELLKIGTITFTKKEIAIMPKFIQRLILVEKRRCRLRTKKTGKNSISYEIRFRCDGYNVSASGKTIELAKQNMLEKLKTAKPVIKIGNKNIPTTFNTFANYYFENFRREKVTKKTMENDLSRYNKYLKPFFQEKDISKITPLDCKTLLNTVKNKGKTCDELHSLLNLIFKCAINHNIITINPLNMVLHIKHEKEHGKALTKDEEKLLLNSIKNNDTKSLIALLLYTGIRPNELETARKEKQFIIAINSKRKNGKIEYKKIPICNKLKPFIIEIPKERDLKIIRKEFNTILPNHRLYDLRTTFYTRCQELSVEPTARNLFVGHSLGVLGNTYTDISDEYLLKEGEKLNKWK